MRSSVLVFALCSLGCSTVLDFEQVSFDDARDAGTSDASLDSGGAGGSSATGGSGGTESTEAGEDALGGSGGTVADVGTEPNPCEGVGCSDKGTCHVADGGQPTCVCDSGFHAEGLQCVVDESCTGMDCGRCGQCEVIGGLATCTCPSGFRHDGTGCVTDPNPCDTVDCGPDGVCVPEAHCQPLGACVATCDCSNCGNCGPDNTDGRWNDWQEYCGAEPNQSPATVACNKPCPSGEGCLPYSQPMCWPMEGCFSL